MFGSQSGLKQPLSTSLCEDTGDVLIRSTTANLRIQKHEPAPLNNTNPPVPPPPVKASPHPGEEELQTIRLAAGGRGAGLEALRQRCHSAPQSRPVKVTLLESHSAPGAQNYNSHNPLGLDSDSQSLPPGRQCDLAKVSELTESVQKLLQRYRGQSLTEEALHRLETLHQQQLFLQNQLLDSALKMVMRPEAPPTSHLSSEHKSSAAEMFSLTPCYGDRPTIRSDGANQSSGVPQEAGHLSDRRLGMTLQEEPEALSRNVPVPHPQNPPRPLHSKPHRAQRKRPQSRTSPAKTKNPKPLQANGVREASDRAASAEPQLNHESYIQNIENLIQCHQEQLKKQQNETRNEERGEKQQEKAKCQDNPSQFRTKKTVTDLRNYETKGAETKNEVLSKTAPSLYSGRIMEGLGGLEGLGAGLQGDRRLQRPGSVLDQARLVLKKVQRQRKVLEANLESQVRSRAGDLLHCQLDALAQNRDCSKEVSIKKTVDSWISALSRENQVQAQKSPVKQVSASAKPSANRSTADKSKPTLSGRVRPMSMLRTATKPPGTSAQPSPNLAPDLAPDLAQDLAQDLTPDPELYLRRLYGKAVYEGQRRSLKKGPYLRLSSPDPAPLCSRSRPRLVETVRGVKLKSCKTQTSPEPGLYPVFNPSLSSGPGPGLGPGLSPGLSPGPVRHGLSFPATAIPLGRPRIESSYRALQEVTSPSRACSQLQQEVTSKHESFQRAVTSADAVGDERGAPDVAVPAVVIIQSSPVQQEEAEFPGTNFLSVVELEQVSEAAVLQLEGGPSPDPVQYQGPQFPPQPPTPVPRSAQEQSIDLGLNIHRDALEQRLVQWVEQQLMSRLIVEMSCPPLTDPTHKPYNPSEPEERPDPAHRLSPVQSETSATLDHRDLDEDVVRGLVLEVLTEVVASFLGSRESQEPETRPRTEPGSGPEEEPEPTEPSWSQPLELLPTPQPTPLHTPPPQTPPRSPVATPIPTPPPSDWPDVKEDQPPEPLPTPPATQSPKPPFVQTQEEQEGRRQFLQFSS